MPIKLDPRLSLCAEAVSENAFVVDVGADHAYLACSLVGSGRACHAIASDIADGPIEAARETVRRLGLTDRVDVVKSDGLLNIPREILSRVTDVIIAGMGGELIAKILSDGKKLLPPGVNFVLQPNSRASALRKYLAQNGFETFSERAVRDGKFIYPVIRAGNTGKVSELSELEAVVGRLDPHEPASREYLLKEASRLRTAASGMSGSASERERIAAESNISLAEKIEELTR